MKENMIGYCRVSTPAQIEGRSLTIQKESIENYCKNNNINLVKIYSDEGLSAYKERPAFQRTKDILRSDQEIKGIIVNDLSRFGRSTLELITTISEIDMLGKKFISLKESFDLSTKTGKLLLTILSAIADYERELIKERMTAGRAYAEKYGSASGLPCHRPKKYIDWDKVMQWRKYGISFTKIAEILSNDKENPDYSISHQTLIERAREEGYYDE